MKHFRFSGNTVQTLLFSLIYSATAFAILSPGLVPADVLWAGQAANIPMIVVGKLIQVFSNLKQGHTGQLSAVTIILLTLGKTLDLFFESLDFLTVLDFRFVGTSLYILARNWRPNCHFDLCLFLICKFAFDLSIILVLERGHQQETRLIQ